MTTLTTSRGQVIETPYSDSEAAAILCVVGAAGSTFARSLAESFGRWGHWTPGQRPWAHKLAVEDGLRAARTVASRPAAPDIESTAALEEVFGIEIDTTEQTQPAETAQPLPEEPTAPVFKGIVALFARAQAARLVRVKISLAGLAVSLAGRGSRYPGHAHITDGRSYGQSRYFGRIEPTGRFVAHDCPPEILSRLATLDRDPAALARLHGAETGRCCFCRLELTDPQSVLRGYGPICAEKWGLPWGELEVPDGYGIISAPASEERKVAAELSYGVAADLIRVESPE